MIGYVTLGTNDLQKCAKFYDELFAEIKSALEILNPEKVRIGGGEPTIRKDIIKVVKYFKLKGIDSIAIQTNGLMLSEKNNVVKLKNAGLSKVNLSIPGFDNKSLDSLTGFENSFTIILNAIKNIIDHKLDIEIDILISKMILPGLNNLIDKLSEYGISKFNFWYISIEGNVLQNSKKLAPSMTDAAKSIIDIIYKYDNLDIKSYYIPYCFLKDHIEKVWHPMDEKAYVITPGESFFLEKGEIDIGLKIDKCEGCKMFDRCFGIRKNYLELFGDEEISRID